MAYAAVQRCRWQAEGGVSWLAHKRQACLFTGRVAEMVIETGLRSIHMALLSCNCSLLRYAQVWVYDLQLWLESQGCTWAAAVGAAAMEVLICCCTSAATLSCSSTAEALHLWLDSRVYLMIYYVGSALSDNFCNHVRWSVVTAGPVAWW